ncbi:hypothetical protein MMC18_005866 [Xylographa bjoerkii]|nr:hypothetical protein [Xylographa bjoerkii]
MENGHYTDVRKIYQAVRLRRFMIYIPRYYSLSLDFTAEASVVHGTLLLLTIFELYPAFGHLSFKALSHTSMGFCPHLRINETTNPEEAENPIMAAIRLAFDVGNDPTKTFSCDFCPTDYSVSRVGQRAIFYVWQEIDSKTSPADPFWPSHATDCKENGRKDAKFEYRHGSIRDMYKNTGTVQCYRPSRKSLWL